MTGYREGGEDFSEDESIRTNGRKNQLGGLQWNFGCSLRVIKVHINRKVSPN